MPHEGARAPACPRKRSGPFMGRSASWKPPSVLKRSAEDLVRLYKAQGGVERGFAFLKDPLFLASSVFVKKVERVMATGFIMVLCLLVYRLAEQHIRQRLAETGATVPDQLKQPTQRPTMRWLFQCFEG